MEIGDKCFIADLAVIGEEETKHGWMTLDRVTTGNQVFVGNAAIVPPGSHLGDGSLIGVYSRSPGGDTVKAGETWYGSPAMSLPVRQKFASKGDVWTFEPTRWMRIRRPTVVAGGEMTIAELDLAYSPSQRFYEAPPHVKANGGLFFLDDFGRQRIDPTDLLNRWIIPLEQQIDYLTLVTGQKIRIPFRLLLIAATNLPASADPAFLRRIGYRIHMEKPDEQRYMEIFRRYAKSVELPLDESLIGGVFQRYAAESRELRACEPRDLIERCRDICRVRHQPEAITGELLDLAWKSYFGDA